LIIWSHFRLGSNGLYVFLSNFQTDTVRQGVIIAHWVWWKNPCSAGQLCLNGIGWENVTYPVCLSPLCTCILLSSSSSCSLHTVQTHRPVLPSAVENRDACQLFSINQGTISHNS